jgi:chromosome partitioning protein
LPYVELPVRKLLLASQRSGVGTTTTAINLAVATARAGGRVLLLDADPVGTISTAVDATRTGHRRELTEVGFDLHGGIWCDVVPGLDVLAPYDEGLSGNEDLEHLLQELGSDHLSERYSCVLVDTGPFMSDRPKHLLSQCDEMILVLRAESLSFKTLPLFFETLKTIQREDGGIGLRGILLTMPDGRSWEDDLRRYLGKKVLPVTIPTDDAIDQTAAVTLATPASPAAVQYADLVQMLDLANGAAATVGKAGQHLPAPAAKRPASSGKLRRVARTGSRPDLNEAARTAATGKTTRRRKSARSRGSVRPWQVWIGAGMLGGTMLGSVRSPEQVIPCAVGLATTAGIVLALKLFGGGSTGKKAPAQPSQSAVRERG